MVPASSKPASLQRPIPPGLKEFWSGTVEQFVDVESTPLEPPEKERHQIFSLLLMSLIAAKWNGNRYGEVGDYGGWRANQVIGKTARGEKLYRGGSYLGHNIAALAVDAEGRIIDFEFNHNQVFESTVEHAESRLVRRIFALNEVYNPWFALQKAGPTSGPPTGPVPQPPTNVSPEARVPYASVHKDVTIYTSLESCAQCSGIMCLSSVKEIVYLQWDQAQFLIGNLMWRATTSHDMGFTAPRPIRGDEFDFRYFKPLNDACALFFNEVEEKPFYKGPGAKGPATLKAVTSFLCTDAAREIFQSASMALARYKIRNAAHQPMPPSGLTNQQVLVQARDFLKWAKRLDSRGAPHRI